MTLNKEFTNELYVAVAKVCSAEYEQMFETVFKEHPNQVSIEQRRMLSLYPNRIDWYMGDRRQEIIDQFRSAHLKWFNNWLNEYNTGRPPYIKWNEIMEDTMLHLNNLFFRIDRGDVITSDETRK
jgi:hypothetical protein